MTALEQWERDVWAALLDLTRPPALAVIGSRSAPAEAIDEGWKVLRAFAARGWEARSGGATGFDQVAARLRPNPLLKEFLPWRGFNGSPSQLFGVCPEALAIAKRFHPNWDAVTKDNRHASFHARNGYQVLGKTLRDPVRFILTWTPGGKDVGGTSQAIRIARYFRLPVFNVFRGIPEELREIWRAA